MTLFTILNAFLYIAVYCRQKSDIKQKNMKNTTETWVEIIPFELRTELELPLFASSVSAGFPLPAEEFVESVLDLNEYLVQNKTSTFLLRVRGDSMRDMGIYDGSILVVDKSLEPADGNTVIAVVDGEFLVKTYRIQGKKHLLVAANKDYAPIEIDETITLWGVATNCINGLR